MPTISSTGPARRGFRRDNLTYARNVGFMGPLQRGQDKLLCRYSPSTAFSRGSVATQIALAVAAMPKMPTLSLSAPRTQIAFASRLSAAHRASSPPPSPSMTVFGASRGRRQWRYFGICRGLQGSCRLWLPCTAADHHAAYIRSCVWARRASRSNSGRIGAASRPGADSTSK